MNMTNEPRSMCLVVEPPQPPKECVAGIPWLWKPDRPDIGIGFQDAKRNSDVFSSCSLKMLRKKGTSSKHAIFCPGKILSNRILPWFFDPTKLIPEVSARHCSAEPPVFVPQRAVRCQRVEESRPDAAEMC